MAAGGVAVGLACARLRCERQVSQSGRGWRRARAGGGRCGERPSTTRLGRSAVGERYSSAGRSRPVSGVRQTAPRAAGLSANSTLAGVLRGELRAGVCGERARAPPGSEQDGVTAALRGDRRADGGVGVTSRSSFTSESTARLGEPAAEDVLPVGVSARPEGETLSCFGARRLGLRLRLPAPRADGESNPATDVLALDGLSVTSNLLNGLCTGVNWPLLVGLPGEKHILDGLSARDRVGLLLGLPSPASPAGRSLGEARAVAPRAVAPPLSQPARNADEPRLLAAPARVILRVCRASCWPGAEPEVLAVAGTGSRVPRTRFGRHRTPISRQMLYTGSEAGARSPHPQMLQTGGDRRCITSVEPPVPLSPSSGSPGTGPVRHSRRCWSSDTVAS